jgi:hypothetical protein
LSKGEALIVRSYQDWLEQARAANKAIAAKLDGRVATLRECAQIDPEQFGLMIEALVALGEPVSQELQDLAGLKPVNQVLGLPT